VDAFLFPKSTSSLAKKSGKVCICRGRYQSSFSAHFEENCYWVLTLRVTGRRGAKQCGYPPAELAGSPLHADVRRRLAIIAAKLRPGSCQSLTSSSIGLGLFDWLLSGFIY
jgi:hypothetical protein